MSGGSPNRRKLNFVIHINASYLLIVPRSNLHFGFNLIYIIILKLYYFGFENGIKYF